jgi:hypothetical protein
VHQQDKRYFVPLNKQIDGDGAAAMFFDLQRMDLGDWHPREIPQVLLKGAALRKQQGLTLPPLEHWYLMVLQDGQLPGALQKRPNTILTMNLMDDAKQRVPRLRFDLTEVGLRDFLTSKERIGIECQKYRSSHANGWSFPLLAECRQAWVEKYGPVDWDDAEEWFDPYGKPAEKPVAAEPKVAAKPKAPSLHAEPGVAEDEMLRQLKEEFGYSTEKIAGMGIDMAWKAWRTEMIMKTMKAAQAKPVPLKPKLRRL